MTDAHRKLDGNMVHLDLAYAIRSVTAISTTATTDTVVEQFAQWLCELWAVSLFFEDGNCLSKQTTDTHLELDVNMVHLDLPAFAIRSVTAIATTATSDTVVEQFAQWLCELWAVGATHYFVRTRKTKICEKQGLAEHRAIDVFPSFPSQMSKLTAAPKAKTRYKTSFESYIDVFLHFCWTLDRTYFLGLTSAR